MSAAEVARLRRAYEDALRHRDDCGAAARKQSDRVRQLRNSLESRRSEILAERLASNGGASNARSSSAGELQDLELDIEAAEVLARELEHRAKAAGPLCDRAEQAWKKSVCKMAQDVEAAALLDVEAALTALGAACARGIAAAKISLDFGEIRGSYSMDGDRWFGASGYLVSQIQRIDWPTWPNRIAAGPFASNIVGDPSRTLAGVAEAEREILASIEGAQA